MEIISKCLWCKKDLNEKQTARRIKTCSRSCANRWRYRDVQKIFVCQGCGKEYEKKNTGNKIGIKYCSPECVYKFQFTKKKSDAHKQQIAIAQTLIRQVGDYKCDRCGIHFESNTALRAHKSHCGHVEKIITCAHCGKEFTTKAGMQLHLLHTTDADWKRRISRNVRRSNCLRIQKSEGTDIEIRLKQALIDIGLEVKCQHCIGGEFWHCYDFFIPKYSMFVEADGEYWHGHESKPSRWASEHREFDAKVVRYAKENGYLIIRFWGNDILNNTAECIREIVEYGETGKHPTNGRARCL